MKVEDKARLFKNKYGALLATHVIDDILDVIEHKSISMDKEITFWKDVKLMILNIKGQVQIIEAFTITGRGTVISCNITKGKISSGDKIVLNKTEYDITGIEAFCHCIDPPKYGSNVGLLVRGITKEEANKYNGQIVDII